MAEKSVVSMVELIIHHFPCLRPQGLTVELIFDVLNLVLSMQYFWLILGTTQVPLAMVVP